MYCIYTQPNKTYQSLYYQISIIFIQDRWINFLCKYTILNSRIYWNGLIILICYIKSREALFSVWMKLNSYVERTFRASIINFPVFSNKLDVNKHLIFSTSLASGPHVAFKLVNKSCLIWSNFGQWNIKWNSFSIWFWVHCLQKRWSLGMFWYRPNSISIGRQPALNCVITELYLFF